MFESVTVEGVLSAHLSSVASKEKISLSEIKVSTGNLIFFT